MVVGFLEMRKWLFIVLFGLGIFVSQAEGSAAPRRFGVGVVVAGPTGLTAEYFYAKNKDIAASLGWGQNSFHLNLDHHWNRRDFIRADGVAINVYFGLGMRWLGYEGRHDSANDIGVRLPFGVQHIFKEVPIQIFFELAPALVVVDHTNFVLDIALGARYFF